MDQRFIFIGDSVTDAEHLDYPPFGFGYVSKIAASGKLLGEIINVGISGNRLVDLEDRWDRDVISRQPTCLSVAIGINDTWRRYDSNDPTSLKDFRERYNRVLERVRALGDVRLALCEPFLLPVRSEMQNWRDDLDPKIEAVHEIANSYSATVVPFDRMFAKLTESTPITDLAEDGIHPTDQGHQFMAELWLTAMGF